MKRQLLSHLTLEMSGRSQMRHCSAGPYREDVSKATMQVKINANSSDCPWQIRSDSYSDYHHCLSSPWRWQSCCLSYVAISCFCTHLLFLLPSQLLAKQMLSLILEILLLLHWPLLCCCQAPSHCLLFLEG